MFLYAGELLHSKANTIIYIPLPRIISFPSKSLYRGRHVKYLNDSRVSGYGEWINRTMGQGMQSFGVAVNNVGQNDSATRQFG